MRILIINGSLRPNGSTSGVVGLIQEQLKKQDEEGCLNVDVVNLSEKRILMSASNFYCQNGEKETAINDDVKEIVSLMVKADAIIYAFPVYAFGVNSLMQAFLERSGVGFLRFKRPLEGKLALIVVTGRRYAHEMAWGQVALNVMLNKMILTGSGFVPVIKNDGKLLGETIIDQEGIIALKDSVNGLIKCFKKIEGSLKNEKKNISNCIL